MKKGAKGRNPLLMGIFIGVVLILVIALILLIAALSSRDIRNTDVGGIVTEDFVFVVSNVHQNINNDFAQGVVPSYDSNFCMVKYKESNAGEPDACYITDINTFSRLNPIITQVTCLCKI